MTELAKLLEVPTIEIQKKLFALRKFDFITVTDRGKNEKQDQCLHALTSGTYREILYGGAAGGAKSWTGAVLMTFMCESFPGTRWFVGREELKRAKESTYITFLKVFKAYGIEGVKYNGNENYILFSNGSRIDFLELKYYPSDPLYERFGSIEYTGGWIEEAGEINFAAFDVLKTRIGRHLNDQFGIKPILFITCNPKKNWLYYEFYIPWKQKELRSTRIFIQAFVQDNPAIESNYIEQLQGIQDKAKKERLLLGNWEYEDDPATLCDYDAICDAFTNEHVKGNGIKYVSADLAMQGRDRFIAGVWDGLVCYLKIEKKRSTGKEIEIDLRDLMVNERISRSYVVVDSDGLGAYIESYLTGIKEFHGNAIANDKKEFANLKSECAFKLAELINKRMIRIECTLEQKELITQELGVLKRKDVDADESRKRIIKKDEMKILLGRSPDFLDMLIMRMYWLVKVEIFGYSS